MYGQRTNMKPKLPRGLPLGYLNRLEERLAETEAALYGALMTLPSTSPTTVVQATAEPDSARKAKATRLDEWSRLPLRTWSDMKRWQAAMGDQFTIEQPRAKPFTESSGGGYATPILRTASTPSFGEGEARGSTLDAWQPREDVHMGSSYETHLRPLEMMSAPVRSRGQAWSGVTSPDRSPELTNVTGTDEGRKEFDQSIMADELSKSQPSIYF
ncbi:uncharacterized protein N7477_006077 [Penicillium maclennaniae]|uniref:uncharacterized protein n=1 Tax=Penicillium maclennaniae TaxID=1343394 RepID=UPI002540DBA5|nr:uncharacterized protein N7477_006077 [Penicillium maclennaniae]KAJ5670714.1 hypothetical protein N7477_006077 [Penicillium maclennaniae]